MESRILYPALRVHALCALEGLCPQILKFRVVSFEPCGAHTLFWTDVDLRPRYWEVEEVLEAAKFRNIQVRSNVRVGPPKKEKEKDFFCGF